jgi:hypothetical protein
MPLKLSTGSSLTIKLTLDLNSYILNFEFSGLLVSNILQNSCPTATRAFLLTASINLKGLSPKRIITKDEGLNLLRSRGFVFKDDPPVREPV